MIKRIVRNGPAWPLAHDLLGDWLGERKEVGLGEARSGLAKAAEVVDAARAGGFPTARFILDCVNGAAGADALSRLLRARGFRKAGMTGSALTYDRQPLYRRA